MRTLKPSTRDKMIKRLLSLVSVTHEALEEDMSPEDHFSGEHAADDCADIRARLRSTPWAWCCVKTTVSLGDIEESTYLGGCSYLSLEDFERCEGSTQAYEACSGLLDTLIACKERGTKASALLSDLKRG
jgi:hypothetical protein